LQKNYRIPSNTLKTIAMTRQEIKALRKEVARFMRRLYNRGLTTASGGNISARLDKGIFITPSALDKGLIRGKEVGMIMFDGKNFTPDLKPSMEYAMHLAIYKKRPDVKAIVHAHPPLATSFTAMQKTVDCSLIAEARAILGTPVRAPYALMGTPALAETAASAAVYDHDLTPASNQQSNRILPNVILLENHGVVCLGKDLLTAFDRLEVLEAAARMTLITSLMGGVSPLSEEQLVEIDRFLML
jgi:L-fuculose-phosphate aldolase